MIHITIGGERIPISEMTLSHLINTINCIKRLSKEGYTIRYRFM